MATTLPPFVSSFVEVGGVTLHARRDAAADGVSSTTPILHLHSLGADLRIFDRVVARLTGFDHLRLDLRGHGLSDAPEGGYTIADLAADALGVLDAAGAEKAVLVGVSVGGLVALRTALDHPERVAGLVLSNTAAKISDEDVWRARIDTVAEQGVASLADSTLLRWFPEGFRDANAPLIQGYTNMIARTSPRGYAGVCAALGAEDLRERLPQLHPPTLVVGGSEDLSTPPPVVTELARALPNGRLEIIDDAGHLPMVDAPERFAALLTEYLEEHVDMNGIREGSDGRG